MKPDPTIEEREMLAKMADAEAEDADDKMHENLRESRYRHMDRARCEAVAKSHERRATDWRKIAAILRAPTRAPEDGTRIDDFIGEPRPDLPRPTPPSGGWLPPSESVAYQEGLPIAAWLSWTCQKAGIYEEDPIAGLLCEANCAIGHVDTSEHRQYLAWAIASATRHYVALLEVLRAALIEPSPNEGVRRCFLHGGTVDVDASIADLVIVLNENGFRTVASCSGHGFRPGNIALADGRELVICRDFTTGRQIDALFPLDIHGQRYAYEDAMLAARLTPDSEVSEPSK